MNIYSGRCTFSTLTATINLPICQALSAQVTRACCLRFSVFVKVELLFHFSDEDHRFSHGLESLWTQSIWCVVGQKTFCHKVQSLLGFFCLFFVEEKRRLIRVVVPLHRSIFIEDEMEDGNVRFTMERKGQYSRIAFGVKNNLVLHPFISCKTAQDVSF